MPKSEVPGPSIKLANGRPGAADNFGSAGRAVPLALQTVGEAPGHPPRAQGRRRGPTGCGDRAAPAQIDRRRGPKPGTRQKGRTAKPWVRESPNGLKKS